MYDKCILPFQRMLLSFLEFVALTCCYSINRSGSQIFQEPLKQDTPSIFSFFFHMWINIVMIKCSCPIVVPPTSSPELPLCFGSFLNPAAHLRGERAEFGPAGWIRVAPGRSYHQGHMGARSRGEKKFWENHGGWISCYKLQRPGDCRQGRVCDDVMELPENGQWRVHGHGPRPERRSKFSTLHRPRVR